MILSTCKIKNRRCKKWKRKKNKNIRFSNFNSAVLGLTVAFAALSQTLIVNGTANVGAASWDIRFESIDGTNKVIPVISRSNEGIMEGEGYALMLSEDCSALVNLVEFTRSGDTYTYKFNIVNNGMVDASISEIIKNTPVFGSNVQENGEGNYSVTGTAKEEDKEIFNKYFIWKLTYTDSEKEVSVGDELRAGEKIGVTLVMGIDINAPKLPTYDSDTGNAFTFENVGLKIKYSQK